jgi:hypothetical protein
MDQEQTDATAPSVQEELAFLALRGASEPNLAQCPALLTLVTQEIREAAQLTAGARVALLRKVLLGVITEHRERAAAHLDDVTLQKAAEQPMFQIAATGELLRLTDEVVFARVSAHRISKWPDVADWVELAAKIKPGDDLAMARLRAAIWLGSSHPRTAGPDRRGPEVLTALENAIPAYVHDNRDELIASFDDLAASEEAAGIPSANPIDAPIPSPAWRRTMTRQKGGLLAAAVLLVAIGVVVVVALLDGRPSADRGTSTPPSNSQPTASMQERLENAVPRCVSLPPESPLAREMREKRQVVVDGRCDSDIRAPVGSQATPTRGSADGPAFNTGDVLSDICVAEGEETSDLAHSTKLWVRFTAADGRQWYISAIWTHGEEGAAKCA